MPGVTRTQVYACPDCHATEGNPLCQNYMCGSENLQRYVKYLASAVTPLLDLGSTSDLLEPTAENFLMRIDFSITLFRSGKDELRNI